MLKSPAIIQKTKEDYNIIAKHFSVTRHFIRPELKQFDKLIKDGQKVLDWGCGNGNLSLLIKDKKIEYYGVDQSEELLKFAKDFFPAQAVNAKVKFYCTADKDKEFPSNYFDLVFMVASFHHLPDRETRLKLLKKTYKEMKPDANLIMTVWNLESNWAKEKSIKEEWEKTSEFDYLIPWKNQAGEIVTKRYYHNFQVAELSELLEESGFKILENSYYNKVQLKFTKDKSVAMNLVSLAIK